MPYKRLVACLQCMHSCFLLTGCCLEDKQSPTNYNYKLLQKALSTLRIYKSVIRLKSQVLSKKVSRLVADRHTCNQFLLLELKAPDALTT